MGVMEKSVGNAIFKVFSRTLGLGLVDQNKLSVLPDNK